MCSSHTDATDKRPTALLNRLTLKTSIAATVTVSAAVAKSVAEAAAAATIRRQAA